MQSVNHLGSKPELGLAIKDPFNGALPKGRWLLPPQMKEQFLKQEIAEYEADQRNKKDVESNSNLGN